MVINADLCWPEASEKYLWQLALKYATYLLNITPMKYTGRSQDKIWHVSISNHENSGLTKPGDVLIISYILSFKTIKKCRNSHQGLGEDIT